MVNRVVMGNHPLRGMGLHVSRPGFNALAEDPLDRTKFSFSSLWSDTANWIMSGTVAAKVWVSLPPTMQFWPLIHYDFLYDATTYLTDIATQFVSNDGSQKYTTLRFEMRTRKSGGIYQFGFFPQVIDATTNFRYIVTQFKVGQ